MTETLRKPKRLTLASAALFLLVYAAVLLIVLAPRDLLTATPGSLHQTQD